MQLDRFVFIPKISLKPDRVTLFNEVLVKNFDTGELKTLPKTRKKVMDLDTSEEITFKKQFHKRKKIHLSENGRDSNVFAKS